MTFRLKLALVLVAFAVLVLLLLRSGCSDRFAYEEMGALSKLSPKRADRIAEGLSRSTNGVLLAAKNLTAGGGPNRGYNRWILLTSPLTNLVENTLVAVCGDRAAGQGKRVEAAWILWQRTADPAYLETILSLVRDPGGGGTRL